MKSVLVSLFLMLVAAEAVCGAEAGFGLVVRCRQGQHCREDECFVERDGECSNAQWSKNPNSKLYFFYLFYPTVILFHNDRFSQP